MKKNRLSLNQKDIFFVLAMLEVKNITNPVPVAKLKKMIDSSRTHDLDPSNFRKGIHSLASRGLLDVVRANDLSLAVSLSSLGRHDAARIYRERTGNEMDVVVVDDEQMTIFEVVAAVDTPPAEVVTIDQQIVAAMTDYCDDAHEEAIYKFNHVVNEIIEHYGLASTHEEFADKLIVELLTNPPCNFLNLRTIRYSAHKILNDLKGD